jgi:hypothetical protein
MKTIIGIIAISIITPALCYGQLLVQQRNEDGTFLTTTATGGNYWSLSGTIHDLTQFSGTNNPFGWTNSFNYESISVVDGVWQGTATGTSPRMMSANTYDYSMGTYRYLEFTIRKQSILGTGVVRFGKDGNSVVTSGQVGTFTIQNGPPASIDTKQNTFILDMNALPTWTSGNLTALALELHEGQANSVIGTTDYLYSVRISDGITAIPEPTSAALLLAGAGAIGLAVLRRKAARSVK